MMQFISSSGPVKKSDYDTDFNLWVDKTVSLLREERFDQLDLLDLIEEVEDLGKSQRRALTSDLTNVLMHLLKYKYQPQKRSTSWLSSIAEHRDRIELILEDSPSLKNYIDEVWEKSYGKARIRAAIETELPIKTFPLESPFTPDQALDIDWLPEQN
ncbi:DUF29 domain-containing protein [Nostoc sp.]|uniref:DUF29 domain-containing protein n=1 Tax=Nostoc sp. TaxID=1180 RepID=UPI003593A8B4